MPEEAPIRRDAAATLLESWARMVTGSVSGATCES